MSVRRYMEPAQFTALRDAAMQMGFREMVAGPLVRSSYHANQVATEVTSQP
ncbi:MAG: Lipoyl synthase (EC [uncultured Paraburkholderia sp.]|nr:MAG: Lipoyl synthase (EC [uncultured Paraburkholderia sp.]CAH2938774.1 MAG: Lipoyl synthase (EC [uncultured Paraburkholderia sp.]